MAERLGDVADLVRSKNAGPFWLTFDVFLASDDLYARAKDSPLTDAAWFAEVYGVPRDAVEIHPVPAVRAIKVSIPRPCIQGSLDDHDQHGGQQFAPLMGIELP